MYRLIFFGVILGSFINPATANEDAWESWIVNHNDCKNVFEGKKHPLKAKPTLAEELIAKKEHTCNIWALASFISLQYAGKVCSNHTYEVMQKAVSLAYRELPAEAGEKMIWSFPDIASAMYPCTSTEKN